MIRRPAVRLAALPALVVLVAACASSSPTPTPTGPQTSGASPSAVASGSPSSSASASGSATASGSLAPSASPTENLGLQHVNAALEQKLPDTIGGVALQRFSVPVATYIASSQSGSRELFTPWLVHFGKSPDDIDMAVAVDLSQTITFFELAIQVPGQQSTALYDQFGQVARDLKWTVTPRIFYSKNVLQIVDPASTANLNSAYVYAYSDILYIIGTDTPSQLVEALIKAP